ncbi:MAG: hypothetical protein FJ012_08260 [Chloroflexi bacterium]|nr:hypothetical protein [Chloroflexota bacterium]
MEYITSRGFKLPDSVEGMQDRVWFNMWQSKLWPFEELLVGDILYWYESPNKYVVWKTRVEDVDRFQYENKDAAGRQLKERFGDFDRDQPYYVGAPTKGYCLACKVRPLQRVNIPKPNGLRFPQQGWLRVSDDITREWLLQATSVDDLTLDDVVPSGSLLQRLHQLNHRMAEISPDRVRSVVSQTVRRDTDLIKALKELCGFRCQFPNCGMTIPMRNGGFYVEVAHIEPVRKGGRSVLGNLVVLCPNHHKEFDYGVLEIVEQTTERVHGKLNGRYFEIVLPVASSIV